MPTYEYECAKCGKRFEMFQMMKDDPITRCHDCKGKVHRLLGGGSGIIFKGSGFYETDYKKKSAPSCSKSKSDGCGGCSLNKGKKN
jgi:putative FmdB family regulatory protein